MVDQRNDYVAVKGLDPLGNGILQPVSNNPRSSVDSDKEYSAVSTSAVTILLQKVVLSGIANSVAACFTNPFDLIKVRQQLEQRTSSISSPSAKVGQYTRSTNWISTLRTMVRNEGFLSIYKGLSASVLREASYGGIRMGAYDLCKTAVVKATGGLADKDSFGTKLGGGVLSGMLGSGVANPADLLKVRMQTLGATGTLRSHARSIYSEHGIRSLYRAVWPTMLRAAILTSSQLGVYDHTKFKLIQDPRLSFREGFGTHLLSSGVAGFACSAASAPVDVVKVRIMSDKAHVYKNALHCTALILKNEGPLAFYKGFTMCFLRLFPHSVLSLLALEQLRNLAGIAPI